MTPDVEPDLKLEIAYLLFIDVVGFSKLLVNEQIECAYWQDPVLFRYLGRMQAIGSRNADTDSCAAFADSCRLPPKGSGHRSR
jgi:hypothetical protein